jgi:hypothetical protein
LTIRDGQALDVRARIVAAQSRLHPHQGHPPPATFDRAVIRQIIRAYRLIGHVFPLLLDVASSPRYAEAWLFRGALGRLVCSVGLTLDQGDDVIHHVVVLTLVITGTHNYQPIIEPADFEEKDV